MDKMGKEELRAACKAAGIKGYGKWNNTQMREALAGTKLMSETAQARTNTKSQPKQAAQVAPAPVKEEIISNIGKVAPAVAVSAATGKPVRAVKVEANREERNGLVRPSAGGICRAMWDAVEQSIDAGKLITAKEFKVLAEKNDWNWNNASAEYYKARQFRGITGRVK